MRTKNLGSIIGLAAIISAAAAFLVLFLARLNRSTTATAVYLNAINQTYGIANSGLNAAIGKLVLNPNLVAKGTDDLVFDPEVEIPSQKSRYTNSYARRTFRALNGSIISDAYYIVTSATMTTGINRKYSTRLHTYATVSNTGDYFAAVKGDVIINAGIDLDGATIYGKDLDFRDNVAKDATKLFRAEYTGELSPLRANWDAAYKADAVTIEDPDVGPDAGLPVQLANPLLFPQILDSDITRFQDLAHTFSPYAVGHVKCDWRGDLDIFPPGYVGALYLLDNNYLGHTGVNADHVYYCPDDMFIEGTVHGQILFVTPKTIHITGDLISKNLVAHNGPGNEAEFPGHGFASSSTAHQAVLIAGENIIIDRINPEPTANIIRTIHAMMFATDGALYADKYPDTSPAPDFLKLELTGSLIFSQMPQKLSDVFMDEPDPRVYRYMTTLKTHPPPYIPALLQIYYSLEEIVSTPGIYN